MSGNENKLLILYYICISATAVINLQKWFNFAAFNFFIPDFTTTKIPSQYITLDSTFCVQRHIKRICILRALIYATKKNRLEKLEKTKTGIILPHFWYQLYLPFFLLPF